MKNIIFLATVAVAIILGAIYLTDSCDYEKITVRAVYSCGPNGRGGSCVVDDENGEVYIVPSFGGTVVGAKAVVCKKREK